MTLTFRYKRVERAPPLSPATEPLIPVTLKARRELDVLALLDSGSDSVAFSEDIAEIIGADLSEHEEEIVGIAATARAARATVTAIVQQGHERYFIRTKARGILGPHHENFPVIIGRQDSFEKFHITFKENQRRIALKRV